MSFQRRRGEKLKFFPTIAVPNSEGNLVRVADYENPVYLRGQISAQDTSMATVPGQMPIKTYRFITKELKGVNEHSACEWRGEHWVVAVPPIHYGTLETSPWTNHWTLVLRRAEIPKGPRGGGWRG